MLSRSRASYWDVVSSTIVGWVCGWECGSARGGVIALVGYVYMFGCCYSGWILAGVWFPFILLLILQSPYVLQFHSDTVMVAGPAVWMAVVGYFPGHFALMHLHLDWT